MANGISQAFRSFWHTMTSNDRHASYDSPYKTGRHVPLNQSKHMEVGAQATTAMESQTDLSATNDASFSQNAVFSPTLRSPPPYSPGARSTQLLRRGSSDVQTPTVPDPGEIQMQNFEEGIAPPPPVNHSWKRIDRWAEEHFPELFDQLCEGATQNDINELEHELDCSLPTELRESIACHDGQERGGRPTGILFGCMLLDCEEIVQEWRNWRKVNEEYLSAPTSVSIDMSNSKSFAASSSSSSGAGTSASAAAANGSASSSSSSGPNPLWRQELLEKQESHPPRMIQRAYAHSGWIPLARDWGGNCIAVDLAPGPAGKWGQVIIFGRDYDCKYVIARSWSAFLAQVADDFGSGKVEVEDDSEWDSKIRLKLFKSVEPPYLEIMRWRTEQKYGRRISKKRPGKGPGSAGPSRRSSGYGSPYGSPVDERGRSPQRFPATSVGSPTTPVRVESPLAKIHEERGIAKPTPLNPAALPSVSRLDKASKPEKLIDAPTPKAEKLVEAPTPAIISSGAAESKTIGSSVIDKPAADEGKEDVDTEKPGDKVGLGVEGLDDDMKQVQI